MKHILFSIAMSVTLAASAVTAAASVSHEQAPRRCEQTTTTVPLRAVPATPGTLARVASRFESVSRFANPAPIPSWKSFGRAAQNLPEFYGSVIYADGWTINNNEVGVYRIGTSPSVPFTRMGNQHIDATAGGVAVGDTYWSCYFVESNGYYYVYVCSYDTATWNEKSWRMAEIPMISTGVAYDRTTGNIYGCFRNDTNTGYVFGTVDYTKLTRTAIKPLDRMWSAVACSRKGELYAIDELGDLYIIDKFYGGMRLIGRTGLVATHPSSACIDSRTGRMYYAVTIDPVGALYEIDLATGTPTLLYNFPLNQEVVGMFIPAPDADDAAPDVVTDLSLDFTGGSLSGNVSFTMPSTTFGGEAGTGNISYVVETNGTTAASGAKAYGEAVSVPVTLSAPGSYTFKVYASNAFGDGPATEATMFVGNDLPVAPQLTAAISNGVVTLSWEPVTESANGGYIDADNITYTVKRLPDGKIIADGTKETSVTDTPDATGSLVGYSYVVTARSGNNVSAESTSRKFWIGSLATPYTNAFTGADKLEAYTIVDVNNDGITWEWNGNLNALSLKCSSTVDNNDWLITPPVKLEQGKMYKFTATLRTYMGNPEKVEIKWGKDSDPTALTEELMAPQVIKCRTAEDFVYYLVPEETGTYFVGIHGITGAYDGFFLFADAISIGAGVDAVIPAVVENLTVTPDFNGDLSAEISFNAPTKAVDGSVLESLMRIDVKRDGTVVKSFPAPTPGASLSYTDRVDADGEYKYEIIPFSSAGAGRAVHTKVYIGANEPASTAWVNIEETSVPGEVRLSWAPVNTDKNGNPLNPSLVKYNIYAPSDGDSPVVVAEDLPTPFHTFTAVAPGKEQEFVYYAVIPHTAGGEARRTLSATIAVGASYTVPYRESFASGYTNTIIRTDNRQAAWSLYDDQSGIPTQDADNGMAGMFGEFAGSDASLFTGKISLASATNPALVFYTYNITGSDADLNEIEVGVSTGSADFTPVHTAVMSQLGDADGWYPVVVPLNNYVGKDVQFELRGVTRTRKFTLVDNIQVVELSGCNLRMGALSVPAVVYPDVEFTVSAIVENMSLSDASGYSVKLLRNGSVIETVTPSEVLPAGESQVFNFTQLLNVTHDETLEYQAVLEYSADTEPEDNSSAKVVAQLKLNSHPVPVNLRGSLADDGVKLTWDEPDLAAAIPDAVTETFESFESWNKTGDNGWTFVDLDKAGIGLVGQVAFPGIEYNSQLAWFVMDASYPGLVSDFAAASGNKYLASIFNLRPTDDNLPYIANNDWAVSPLLYGGEQTVSMLARSLNLAEAAESFEVWYSTVDSTDPADFRIAGTVESVAGTWTAYSFKLPAGALRFAIRYTKTYGLMINIDDVTYVPDGKSSLILEGYNVYRDGVKVNELPVKERSFTDVEPLPLDGALYAVTAHYGESGESRPGNAVKVTTSGIADVEAAVALTVTSRRGEILIKGAAGCKVVVTDALGRVVAAADGKDVMTVAAPCGVYIVTAGNRTAKVLVP